MTGGNVVVLSADSLRLDRTLDPDVMPLLADLGERSVRFTDAVANGPFTPASFPTLLASRYASSIDGIGIPEEGGVTTIAEELKREGYRTSRWSDNKFVGEGYNYGRGYEAGAGYETGLRDRVREYVDETGLLFEVLEFAYMGVWKRLKNATSDAHYYATAADLQAGAREWLDGLDPAEDDVHLWVHYMDTHHPYEPPEEFMPYDDLEVVESRTEANNLSRRVVRSDGADADDRERRDVRRLYDAECEYLDDELRSFVGWLESAGWLGEEDLLVITSDHGEILAGWEQWGSFGHENVFTEECTRVPLVLRRGDLDPVDVDAQASLIDLLPTVLELVGIDPPGDLVMGESLVPTIRGEASGRDRVFYDGTLSYDGVRHRDGRKVFNCEHLGPDDYVQTNYAHDPRAYDEEPITTRDPDGDLLEFLDARRADCDRLAEESKGIDPASLQVEQHMRDLGYLE